jgi:hypothetical protein
MSINCPQCHAEVTLSGKIYNQVDYVNPSAYFRPSGFPLFAIFRTNIQLQNNFLACSFCGLIWSNIDNQELQRFVANKGVV